MGNEHHSRILEKRNMMRIGISYWGFCEVFSSSGEAKTPDGHRYGRPIFVDAATTAGHQVYSLQKRREAVPYKNLQYDEGLPDLDVLFIEWRWPTYKNSGKSKVEPDLDRQTELLQHYHGKIPIVIWDCDYKVTAEDELAWPHAIIADPAFDPRSLTRKRERLMFWSDWKFLFDPAVVTLEYGYVGNNYERPDAFLRYYSNVSEELRKLGIQTTVHGNWLEISPEREHPVSLIKSHPHISFAPRLNFYDSMKRLNSFICTTHITKPEYAKRGFVSPRYLENVVAGTPALVPAEFLVPNLLGNEWIAVSSSNVVNHLKYINGLSYESRVSLVKEQMSSLKNKGVFSISEVVNFLESVT
jgi:hypothetical protein